MSLRDDFYSKEGALIDTAKRELANGIEKDPIYKLRLINARGATGILRLGKSFRKMDRNSNSLGLEDVAEAMKHSGLDWSMDDIKTLFNSFEVNKDGSINTTEFLAKLRPSIPHSRLHIIEKAFDKMDNNRDGVITVADLKHVYCVRNHSKYLSGELTETEILQEFLDNFAEGPDSKEKQAKVTKEEFMNYYATISASIDNDGYFDLLMRRAYKL